jgi:hypothetical protein
MLDSKGSESFELCAAPNLGHERRQLFSIREVTLCFLDLLPSEISELAVLSDYFRKIAPAKGHVEINPRFWDV